jgi:prefoldin subunit 5
VNKGTGNKQSMRIEGAVTLSPKEKQNLSRHFIESEKNDSLEKDLEKLRLKIESLKSTCDKVIEDAERAIKDFFELFHEKVEVNKRLYKVNKDQIKSIQNIFIQKDQFIHGIPKYRDQFASVINNIRQTEVRHLDFSDKDIVSNLKKRIDALSNYKQAMGNIIESVNKDVTSIVENWIQILESMEPDTEKMNSLEIANCHLTSGRANKAKEILESVASSTEGLTEETFHLLLKCYVRLGLREEYKDAHKRLHFPEYYR